MAGQSPKRKLNGFIGVIIGVVAVSALGVYGLVQMLSAPPQPMKKTVQQISLVRPPPPPPEEKPPPPPPEVEEEVDIPEPEDIPEPSPIDEPPPSDILGLDADGSAGADGFGLVARRGGRDLLASGGSQYRWYANVMKQSLLDHLASFEGIRSQRYTILVRMWLTEDGTVQSVDLAGTTGNNQLDEELRTALASLRRIDDRPPRDLPQPVQLQIVSRL